MTRICAISDTHTKHDILDIPECDVLVCAGDYNIHVEWDMDNIQIMKQIT